MAPGQDSRDIRKYSRFSTGGVNRFRSEHRCSRKCGPGMLGFSCTASQQEKIGVFNNYIKAPLAMLLLVVLLLANSLFSFTGRTAKIVRSSYLPTLSVAKSGRFRSFVYVFFVVVVVVVVDCFRHTDCVVCYISRVLSFARRQAVSECFTIHIF